ncbi:MAG: YHYH protein, partial [Chthoniobacterales bacterium]
MDAQGQIVKEDRWLPNTVAVDFRDETMVISSLNIPNHPTGIFPEQMGNRNHIQVQNEVVYLPLNPTPNPSAISMTYKNANRALPMGPTGIAINGVVFYNPFDMGMEEAVNIMDRCCGHPDQRNRYHYHKYPVCTRSPFDDNGEEHSKLIGWAFDGFPVYGPYEGKGEMAMNSKSNPLNAFNIHYDKDRGWHYHVTPGKFPYIFGGYWGVSDPRNFPRHGPPGRP